MGEPYVSSNYRVFSNCDAAQYGGVGVNGHAIFQYRVAGEVGRVAVRVPADVLGPQGDSLVQSHVVTNNGSFPNHYSSTVVYGESLSDLRGGMDVNSCY